MKNFIRQFSYAALLTGTLFTGTLFMSVTEAEAQKRSAPQDARFYVGEPRRVGRAVLKTSATIVPVVDSNAILNLDYNELRSTPAAAPKKPAAPVAQSVVPKEVPLNDLKMKLRLAEDNFKAAQLAHTQAVRSKDKTRVETAVKNRATAANEVLKYRNAIAAREPAKVSKRPAPVKKTQGTIRKQINTETTK